MAAKKAVEENGIQYWQQKKIAVEKNGIKSGWHQKKMKQKQIAAKENGS